MSLQYGNRPAYNFQSFNAIGINDSGFAFKFELIPINSRSYCSFSENFSVPAPTLQGPQSPTQTHQPNAKYHKSELDIVNLKNIITSV